MPLVIDLPRSVEVRIEQEASRTGVSPAQLITDIVTKNFAAQIDSETQARLNQPSIALLQSWLTEAEKPRTQEEQADAEEDLQQLMRNLNTPRREAGERLHFPGMDRSL